MSTIYHRAATPMSIHPSKPDVLLPTLFTTPTPTWDPKTLTPLSLWRLRVMEEKGLSELVEKEIGRQSTNGEPYPKVEICKILTLVFCQ